MAFTSIRHALGQLEQRNAAEQSRRQQNLASPRRLILNALQQRGDRAARQRVGAFVFPDGGMAPHPVPLDLVRRRRSFQPLP